MGWDRTPGSLGKHIARPCIENVTGRNRGNTREQVLPHLVLLSSAVPVYSEID